VKEDTKVRKTIKNAESEFYRFPPPPPELVELQMYFSKILALDKNSVIMENIIYTDNSCNLDKKSNMSCSVLKLDLFIKGYTGITKDISPQIDSLGFVFNECKVVDSLGNLLKYITPNEDLYKNPITKDKWPGYNQVLMDAFGSFLTSDFNYTYKDEVVVDRVLLLIEFIMGMVNK